MSLKIDQDHSRFRNIVRGKIRQNLRQVHLAGRADRAQGQGPRLDPDPADRHPALPLRRQAAGRRRSGRRRRRRSGRRRAGRGGRRRGHKPGKDAGEHVLEVDVTLDELADILGEELELPDIENKGKSKIIDAQGPLHRHPPRRPRVAAPLQAHLPRGAEAADRERAPTTRTTRSSSRIRDDKRYRCWKTDHEPVANAVIIYMMDVSGSMGDEQKEIVRIESFWIDTWLRRQYQGPREPLHHPRRRRARGRSRHVLPHARVAAAR